MATVGTNNIDLVDFARRQNPDGRIDRIVELLNQTNEVLDDLHYMECNDGTTNITTVRTGLPTATWRKLYGGVPSGKSTTAQVSDTCGMLEALPKVDCDAVDKSSDPAGALLSENKPWLEAMAQQVAQTIFYGDTGAYPQRFNGLHIRYNAAPSTTSTLATYNILSGSGASSVNTSIWCVCWGAEACHGLYPKGSNVGLQYQNLGKILTTSLDTTNYPGDFQAYVTKYKWDLGLCVRDWRSVGRICNIDITNLEAESSAADLVKLMIKLDERIKTNGGRKVWYMHPRVRTMLRLQMLSKDNVYLSLDNLAGRQVLAFNGAPVRVSDQLSLAEATIS